MRVKKPVVVITGASSGIGRATALEFADKGARLVLAARSAGALESLVHEVRKRGGKAIAVPTDVTDADPWCARSPAPASGPGRWSADQCRIHRG